MRHDTAGEAEELLRRSLACIQSSSLLSVVRGASKYTASSKHRTIQLETTMKKVKTTLALAIVLAFPMVHAQTATGQVPGSQDIQSDRTSGALSYAQHLVDSMAKLHPELLGIDLHATLPGAAQSAILASRMPARV